MTQRPNGFLRLSSLLLDHIDASTYAHILIFPTFSLTKQRCGGWGNKHALVLLWMYLQIMAAVLLYRCRGSPAEVAFSLFPVHIFCNCFPPVLVDFFILMVSSSGDIGSNTCLWFFFSAWNTLPFGHSPCTVQALFSGKQSSCLPTLHPLAWPYPN